LLSGLLVPFDFPERAVLTYAMARISEADVAEGGDGADTFFAPGRLRREVLRGGWDMQNGACGTR
jgi:hypothetical protein